MKKIFIQEQNLRKELGQNNQEIIINEEQQADTLFDNEINNLFEESNAESLDMNDIFGNIMEEIEFQNEPTHETTEDVENLFNTINGDTPDMNSLFGDIEQPMENDTIIESAENTYVNPIMSGVQLSEEKSQSEYIHEIKKNPLQEFFTNIQARLFNTTKRLTDRTESQNDYQISKKSGLFSKIKHAVSKFINRNQPLTIDTAENNTKTTYEETKSNFDNSLLVSEEEQKKNKAIYDATKKDYKGKSSTINIDDRTSN